MRLAFSTKGWHDATWEDFLTAAQDLGFEGIEIHNLYAKAMQKKGAPADSQAAAAVYRALYDKHLSVPCINVAGDLCDKDQQQAVFEEIDTCISAAKRLHTPYVRLHTVYNTEDRFDEALVREALAYARPKAEQNDVILLIETMGAYANTALLRELLDGYAHDNLAALWDFHLPYRMNGETAQATVTNLGA